MYINRAFVHVVKKCQLKTFTKFDILTNSKISKEL